MRHLCICKNPTKVNLLLNRSACLQDVFSLSSPGNALCSCCCFCYCCLFNLLRMSINWLWHLKTCFIFMIYPFPAISMTHKHIQMSARWQTIVGAWNANTFFLIFRLFTERTNETKIPCEEKTNETEPDLQIRLISYWIISNFVGWRRLL